MKLDQVVDPASRKKRRRLGRGISSGRGKTAGRGTKGQKSRRGHNIPTRFEGGQTPLVQRLPKAGGFTSRSTKFPIVNVEQINQTFKAGERLTPRTLFEKGLLASHAPKVKLVGPGKLKNFLRFENVILTRKLSASLAGLPPREKDKTRKKALAKARKAIPKSKKRKVRK